MKSVQLSEVKTFDVTLSDPKCMSDHPLCEIIEGSWC